MRRGARRERVGRVAAAHLEAVAAHHALDDHLRRLDGERLQEEDRAQRCTAWSGGRSGELQVAGAGEDDAAVHDVVGDQGVQWPRGERAEGTKQRIRERHELLGERVR